MLFNDLLKIGQERRACKNYNPNLKIDQDKINKIYEFALTAPHTMGLELHNIISFSKNGTHFEAVAETMYDFNIARAKGASHIAVLTTPKASSIHNGEGILRNRCIRYTKNLMTLQGKKFQSGDEESMLNKALNSDFAHNNGNNEEWFARQAYIAMGYMLIGAKSLAIESTPIEGFSSKLDEYLIKNKMMTQNERATLVVLFGYIDKTTKLPFVGEKQLRRDINDFVKHF